MNRCDIYDFMRDLLELHNRKKESKKKNLNKRFKKLRSIQIAELQIHIRIYN